VQVCSEQRVQIVKLVPQPGGVRWGPSDTRGGKIGGVNRSRGGHRVPSYKEHTISEGLLLKPDWILGRATDQRGAGKEYRKRKIDQLLGNSTGRRDINDRRVLTRRGIGRLWGGKKVTGFSWSTSRSLCRDNADTINSERFLPGGN